jgi:hypothetical protein
VTVKLLRGNGRDYDIRLASVSGFPICIDQPFSELLDQILQTKHQNTPLLCEVTIITDEDYDLYNIFDIPTSW